MRPETRKLTTAAVCVAVAVVMCVMTAYLPLSFMPLYVAAFSIFLACKRANVVYGILTAASSVGLMFLMTGLSVSWFMLLIMFAPYGILCYFLHRFTYFKLKTGIVRGVIAAAYFNMTLFFIYLIASRVLVNGLDIPVTEWVDALGGYGILAIVGTLLAVPLDFIFSSLSVVILKRIPDPNIKKNKMIESDEEKPAPPQTTVDGNKYDIFGYEIEENDENKNEEQNKDDGNDKT